MTEFGRLATRSPPLPTATTTCRVGISTSGSSPPTPAGPRWLSCRPRPASCAQRRGAVPRPELGVDAAPVGVQPGLLRQAQDGVLRHEGLAGLRGEFGELDRWLTYYNEERPKESLGWMVPPQHRRPAAAAGGGGGEGAPPPAGGLLGLWRSPPAFLPFTF